jgi:muconolactone delta-isomerase
MLFLVTGHVPGLAEPTAEFLTASQATLEQLGELERDGTVRGGGVFIGPLGVCFVVDVPSNEDLHVLLTTLPSFRFAEWETIPLIPFQSDLDLSLDAAVERARE